MAVEKESSTLITAPEKPRPFDFTFLRDMSTQEMERFIKSFAGRSFVIRADTKVYDHTSMSGPVIQTPDGRYGVIALSSQPFDMPRFLVILPMDRYPNYFRNYWDLNRIGSNNHKALEHPEETELYVKVLEDQRSFQLPAVYPQSMPFFFFEKIQSPKSSQL